MRIRMTEQLAGRFRRGVRRNRVRDRVVLTEWDLCVQAVNGGRRTENKLSHAVCAGQLEQVQRAVDICLDVKPRLFQMTVARRPAPPDPRCSQKLFREKLV